MLIIHHFSRQHICLDIIFMAWYSCERCTALPKLLAIGLYTAADTTTWLDIINLMNNFCGMGYEFLYIVYCTYVHGM